ncbi:RagB/SusD family nutrient uptake outer membrane protein [Spirosoma harenae]
MKRVTIKALLGLSALVLGSQACTDLTETTYDVIPTSNFGTTAAQQAALIGPLYNGLGDYWGNLADLNTVTDEQIVPTRGGDWKDGDKWVRLYTHAWNPVTDNGQFNGPWTWCYNNITSINQQLATAKDAALIAELKTLRAFFHYEAMDLFGNVIIADKLVAGATQAQSTRAQVFAFVEKELLDNYAALSDQVGGSYYGRMNKFVADMILAKMYLNAQVYTGTPQWQKAIDRLDNIIKSGKYSLSSDFLSNFSLQNQTSTETILATPFSRTKRIGFRPQMQTLHYLHQLTYNLGQSPWNGFCAVTEFYNSFDDKDARKKMWMVGQQYDATGKPLVDDGVPLVLNPVVDAIVYPAGAAGRVIGARSQKYQIQANNFTQDSWQDNDFIIYRLADAYLMRAEAYLRLGNAASAVADANVVHARAGMPAYTATTLTLDEILAERGRELAWEFHRRQDLIRFGKFGVARRLKTADADNHWALYPIPTDQISLNPNLKQNPGY